MLELPTRGTIVVTVQQPTRFSARKRLQKSAGFIPVDQTSPSKGNRRLRYPWHTFSLFSSPPTSPTLSSSHVSYIYIQGHIEAHRPLGIFCAATTAPHLPPLYQPVSSRGYQDDDTPGVESHVSCNDAAVDLGGRARSSRHGRRQRHDN